jgi:hypothetical protein
MGYIVDCDAVDLDKAYRKVVALRHRMKIQMLKA